MGDIVIPPMLDQAHVRFEYVDPSGASSSRYTGGTQTTAYGGDRVRATIDFSPCGGGSSTSASRRAQLKGLMTRIRGRQGRTYLTDVSSPRRGLLAATELFTNSDFSNGANDWLADAGIGAVSVSDGIARLTALSCGVSFTQMYQAAALTPYVPYALRSIIADGGQSAGLSIGPFLTLSGSASANGYSTSRGYRVASGVALDGSLVSQFPMVFATTTGYTAGAHASCLFTSLARCLQIDGGGCLTKRSDELDHADWVKTELTVPTTNETAPNGLNVGESLRPSTNNGVHHIAQQFTLGSSAATEINIRGCFKRNGYNFVLLALTEGTGSTQSYQMFNLLTGALGTATQTGANWANVRGHIVPLGNDWYYCSLIARKTNAATTITAHAYVYSVDSAANYAGNGSSGIRGWRINVSESSVPARLVQATTAAVPVESQPGGAGFFVKGGRTPAEGALSDALMVGDWIEAGGQLMQVTAPLNLDASGRGFLQASPPPFRQLANDTPVIVHKPMGRFMYPGDSLGWDNEPGLISSAQIDLVEAFALS